MPPSSLPRVKLNPDQIRVIYYVDDPLLVLAGAGLGKTGVITQKIANLVSHNGLIPERVFAVTFTNKAAREIRVPSSGQ